MPSSDAAIELLITEFQDRPLPAVVRRDIRLPDVQGKADALVGMRRTGKTYRLFGEMHRLLESGVPRSRILFLNLEDDRLGVPDLGTLDRALELFYTRDPAARTEGAYLFFDELQVVIDWERFARRVLDTENARLFVTGSSARLLSTDVATRFRGRSLTVEVLPYSMREAARAEGRSWADEWPVGSRQRSEMDAFIADYLVTGGFPGVRGLDPYDRVQALQEYVELVTLRDVGERHAAVNLAALRALVLALFAANAGGFSVTRLHGALTSQGYKVGKATLLAYLDLLTDAFLVFLVPRRTRSLRQRTVNPRKVYAVDPGVSAAMYAGGARNVGAQLENAVYLDLRRRLGRLAENAVGYYKTESGVEVDFAVDDPVDAGPPQLIQVCASLEDGGTRDREIGALADAMRETGAREATVVTLTQDETFETGAGVVRVTPARDWFFGPRREGPVG